MIHEAAPRTSWESLFMITFRFLRDLSSTLIMLAFENFSGNPSTSVSTLT